ncbi:hypothetical protein ACO0LD_27795 [Undibacterium sp. Ji83W]|uniref:hypothetical protein n=1 Tax=Undibacterium sp. Ji83W TaxID=3413043 RepID=UPI003BF36283
MEEVRVKGDRSVDDTSLAPMRTISGTGVIFKSLIDGRQVLEHGGLVALLTDWETEAYPLHALLPSGHFILNRVLALVGFLAGRFAMIDT